MRMRNGGCINPGGDMCCKNVEQQVWHHAVKHFCDISWLFSRVPLCCDQHDGTYNSETGNYN